MNNFLIKVGVFQFNVVAKDINNALELAQGLWITSLDAIDADRLGGLFYKMVYYVKRNHTVDAIQEE